MIEKITREFISSAQVSDYKDDKALIFTYLSNLKYIVNQLVDIINVITIDIDGTKCVDGSAKVNKTDQNLNFEQPEVKKKANIGIDFDDTALKSAKTAADLKVAIEALFAIHKKTYAFEQPLESQQFAHKLSGEVLQTILPEIKQIETKGGDNE